jgi:hypothetical protein
MRHRTLAAMVLTVSVVLTASAPAGDTPRQSDAEIRKLAVGKWYQEESLPNGIKAKGTTTYKQDGTFEGSATAEFQGQTVRVRVSGTWAVDNGMLTETIKESDPATMPKDKSTDKILSISKTQLKRKNDKGKVIEQKRLKD